MKRYLGKRYSVVHRSPGHVAQSDHETLDAAYHRACGIFEEAGWPERKAREAAIFAVGCPVQVSDGESIVIGVRK